LRKIAEHPDLDPEIRAYLEQYTHTFDYHKVIADLLAVFEIWPMLKDVAQNAAFPVIYSFLRAEPHARLEPWVAADMAARGIITLDDAVYEIGCHAISPGRATNLIKLRQNVPALAELHEMWDRGLINREQVAAALERAGMHPDYREPLMELKDRLLSPEVLALAVLKGWLDEDRARREAAGSGITPERFRILMDVTGEPPGLMQLLEAYRRNIIDRQRLHHGIRESRVRNEWIDVVEALRYEPPGYGAVLEGALKGHLDEDKARRLLEETGINPEHYEWMYKSTGNPPGAMEMLDLWNRGEVTEERVVQALRQGHLANAYIPDVLKLKRSLLPPGECVLLVEAGVWTKQQAVRYLMMHGYSKEDAADYAAAGSRAKVREDWRNAKDLIRAQYELGMISREDAVDALEKTGYERDEAEVIASIAELERIVSQQDAAITRIRSLYVGHSIDAATARSALAGLRVPAEQIDDIMRLWRLEREANVKHLTESQIVSAWKYGIIDQAAAQKRLEQVGYTPEDAWILLSVTNKAPLPNRPTGLVSPAAQPPA